MYLNYVPSIVLLLLIFLISVNGASIFPSSDYEEINSIGNLPVKVHEVRKSNNTIEVLVENPSDKNINLKFIIEDGKASFTYLSRDNLLPYATQWFTFNFDPKIVLPSSLKIYPINFLPDNKIAVYIQNIEIYNFNGEEENIRAIINPPEQQIIPDAPEQQQLLYVRTNPTSISYFGFSKIDNINKSIVYYHKDTLGNPILATNEAGNVVYKSDFFPFGKQLYENGNEKFKFAGNELDDSGLYYSGARYYDPNIGRFTQVDPFYNPTQSPYVYANNNPLRYSDSSGEFSFPLGPLGSILKKLGFDVSFSYSQNWAGKDSGHSFQLSVSITPVRVGRYALSTGAFYKSDKQGLESSTMKGVRISLGIQINQYVRFSPYWSYTAISGDVGQGYAIEGESRTFGMNILGFIDSGSHRTDMSESSKSGLRAGFSKSNTDLRKTITGDGLSSIQSTQIDSVSHSLGLIYPIGDTSSFDIDVTRSIPTVRGSTSGYGRIWNSVDSNPSVTIEGVINIKYNGFIASSGYSAVISDQKPQWGITNGIGWSRNPQPDFPYTDARGEVGYG